MHLISPGTVEGGSGAGSLVAADAPGERGAPHVASATSVEAGQHPAEGRLPGVIVAVACASTAYVLAIAVPAGGAALWAVGLGAVAGPVLRSRSQLAAGLSWTARYPLQGSIVLMGASIQLSQVSRTALTVAPLIAFSQALVLTAAASPDA